MRKTLTVKAKRSSILDVTEDDTSLTLAYTPEIRIKGGSESSSSIEEKKYKGGRVPFFAQRPCFCHQCEKRQKE